jgi:fatty-acyl-CoA synthase
MPRDDVYRTNFTPVSFLRRSACIYPNKTAVVHADRRYSYRQFEEHVKRLGFGGRKNHLNEL